jgi:TolA-binding protein
MLNHRHHGRLFKLCVLIGTSLIASACVAPAKKSEAINNERNRRVSAQRKMNQMEHQMQALRDENSLLATALERKDLVEPKLPVEYKQGLAGKDPQVQNEAMLYQKVVESYKAKDERGLEAFEALLTKAYPQSIYRDDVAYYKALLAYHSGRDTEALEKFDLILQRFPQTRRWRDVQLAKAMIYRKMNLLDQERQVLANMQRGPNRSRVSVTPMNPIVPAPTVFGPPHLARPQARTEKIQSTNGSDSE